MSSTPFKLTVKDVLIAARKAINENRLQALTTCSSVRWSCRNAYEDGGVVYNCVIGSALPEKLAFEFARGLIADLRDYNVIEVSDEDFKILQDLQNRHDDASGDPANRKKFTDQFRKLEIRYGLRPARSS